MACVRYEVSFKGVASPPIRTLFADYEVTVGNGVTVVRGVFADQSALHGVLGRIHGLGLELLGVHLLAEPDTDDLPDWGPLVVD